MIKYKKNKQLIIDKNYQCHLREEKLSTLIADDEVLVQIERVSLCGSDYKIFKGDYNNSQLKYPMIIGHEWSGNILKKGKNVKNFEIGDRVTGDCSIYCDNCNNCRNDRNLCEKIKKHGISTNGYAQNYKVVLAKYLYKVDPNMSAKNTALIECFAVAQHSINKLLKTQNVDINEKILIIGAGSIGMSIYNILTLKYQMENIYFWEENILYRGKILKIFPEIKFLNTDGQSKFSIIFDTSANYRTFDRCLDIISNLGVLICIGFYTKGYIKNLSQIISKSIKIIGSIGGTHEFESMIDFLNSHNTLCDKYVQEEYTLSDFFQHFDSIIYNKNILKTQIIMK